MKADQFFVSVIIPVYNGEAFLAKAVESIQQQAYQPLEIIIIDDGSTDGTAKIAASFKDSVRYVYQPNSGPAAARNRGLRMARGSVIGFLDADDLWPENKLELQLACLFEAPPIEIVLGHIQYMRISAAKEGQPRFEKFSEPAVFFNLGSALFRKSVFDKVGLFDETLHCGEDVDWFMCAREKSVSIFILKEVTLLYRMHHNNMIRNKLTRDYYFINALKKSLDRRRQQNNGLAISLPKLPYYEEGFVRKRDSYIENKEKD